MIHSHSEDECRQVAARIAASAGIPDYDVLFSTREFKKTSMRYEALECSESDLRGTRR